ncbi:MAG: GyrI-like domain-containing protein [Pseudomonadota bacterium]
MTAPAAPLYRAEYARRMNRVLDYIDAHLDQPLDSARLADVAHFSRFHFHRIFLAWTGETPAHYARRRRLEKAAFRLSCATVESVLDTALSTGFGSGEAFARAFKRKFGATPTAWRHATPARLAQQAHAIGRRVRFQSNPDQPHSKADQIAPRTIADHGLSVRLRDIAMNVNIIDLPDTRVAYHRLVGPYGPGIGTFWRGTVLPWIRAHGLDGAHCYGVGHDDPTITPPHQCRYDACVEIAGPLASGAPLSLTDLPGGRYAVAAFRGPPAGLADAWMWLTRDWLPASGFQCDERPCFERFETGSALDGAAGQVVCELCIPVRPL